MIRKLQMIRNQKGFTLIELMVVVLIIGILVAIAIPVFGSAANNARLKSDQANLRTIDGAIAQYVAENNADPADVAALVTAKFLKSAPKNPYTQAADYTFASDGNGSVKGVSSKGTTY